MNTNKFYEHVTRISESFSYKNNEDIENQVYELLRTMDIELTDLEHEQEPIFTKYDFKEFILKIKLICAITEDPLLIEKRNRLIKRMTTWYEILKTREEKDEVLKAKMILESRGYNITKDQK